MKRFFSWTCIILICFLLQTTVFAHLALAKVTPSLLVIVTAATGYMRGRKEGMLVGFVCGLLLDLMYSNVIGFTAFILLILGYLNGVINRVYYREESVFPIFLIGISDFCYSFFTYVFLFLLRNRTDFTFYLFRIMIPELLYTVLIAIFLYRLLHYINNRLESTEKGGGMTIV